MLKFSAVVRESSCCCCWRCGLVCADTAHDQFMIRCTRLTELHVDHNPVHHHPHCLLVWRPVMNVVIPVLLVIPGTTVNSYRLCQLHSQHYWFCLMVAAVIGVGSLINTKKQQCQWTCWHEQTVCHKRVRTLIFHVVYCQ